MRRNYGFEDFTLSGSCFENFTNGRGITDYKNGQLANFNSVDEILSKDIIHLKLCDTSEQTFKNSKGDHIM